MSENRTKGGGERETKLSLQNEIPKHTKKPNTNEDGQQTQQLKAELTPDEVKIQEQSEKDCVPELFGDLSW